jgi:predicted peptidase
MKRISYLLVLGVIFASCNEDRIDPTDYNVLSNLPADTGGKQIAVVHESSASPYGHFIYTPGAYEDDGPKYPLLVFLHGAGEKGNSKDDPTKLDLVLKNGPPRMIKRGEWSPAYPMIVASPQCHDNQWNSQKIHEFIKYLATNYQINKKRIYITGLSMGGYGTFTYVGDFGDNSYVAACVPICGGGNKSKAGNFHNVPTWAFHGDADGIVPPNRSIEMIDAINVFKPSPRAKLTMYPGVGHDSWSKTYNGTGMGAERNDYDAFNQSIYDWMFQYQKETVQELIQ